MHLMQGQSNCWRGGGGGGEGRRVVYQTVWRPYGVHCAVHPPQKNWVNGTRERGEELLNCGNCSICEGGAA